jgi:hypothetical protein
MSLKFSLVQGLVITIKVMEADAQGERSLCFVRGETMPYHVDISRANRHVPNICYKDRHSEPKSKVIKVCTFIKLPFFVTELQLASSRGERLSLLGHPSAWMNYGGA